MANDALPALVPPTPPPVSDIQSTSTAGGVTTVPLVTDAAAAPAPVPQEIVGLSAQTPLEQPPVTPVAEPQPDLKPIIPVPVFAEVTAPQPSSTTEPTPEPAAFPIQSTEIPVESLPVSSPPVAEPTVSTTPEEPALPPVTAEAEPPVPEIPVGVDPAAEETPVIPAPFASRRSLSDMLRGGAAPSDDSPVRESEATSTDSVIAPSDDAVSSSVDGTSMSTDADPSAPGEEKSPLDILEEILAGAEAEKKKKEDAEAEKKAAEEQEAAEREAKEVAFQEEAKQRLEVEMQNLEEAKQQRVQVEQDLISQGKIDPNANQQDSAFVIRQLVHETNS